MALPLQAFDFEVRYKKGIDNVAADEASRLPTYGLCDFEVGIDLPLFIVDTSVFTGFHPRSIQNLVRKGIGIQRPRRS